MSASSGKYSGIVILAAGSGSRMGSVKQLLPWKSTSLLGHVIEVALQSEVGPVAVVLGAHAHLIYPKIESEKIHVIHNELHGVGQGTSVSAGARWAIEKKLDGVLYLLGDQPNITAEIIRAMVEKGAGKRDSIVASQYGKTLGVPAYFGSIFYPELQELRGDQGAKSLFTKYAGIVKKVPVPEAELDLDTAEDYRQALRIR